jgi:endonuclease/exonuclease/phosphatase family metal-dependent hydrolase
MKVRLSLTVALAISVLVSGWVYLTTYHPDEIENEAIFSLAPTPQLRPGQQIKLLSWNVQFLAGRPNNNFFFDGGSDPWPSQQIVTETVTAIANIIRQEDPDIILLQELDDGAERTHYEDQLQQLLNLLPEHYAAHTSSFYWLADYVPHTQLLGGVGMKMSIISRYRLEQAKRYALPAITSNDIITRQYNPKRAIQGVSLPIEGGGNLSVLNTHLSAYAQGTDTMARQIASVENVLITLEAEGSPVLLAGDFNLIPTDAAYQDLSDGSRKFYDANGTEIERLMKRYNSVPSQSETLGDNRQDWFTHIANDNKNPEPDKTIDYIFYSDNLFLGEHYVRSVGTLMLSDHLPVVATFTLP